MKGREQTITNLNERVDTLQAELSNLKRHGGASGSSGYARDQGRNRSGRGAGRGAAAAVVITPPAAKKAKLYEDPDFVQDRSSVCQQWNMAGGCKRAQGACIKTHACNQPSAANPKEACKGNHKGINHK